jgi:hypothetical protein
LILSNKSLILECMAKKILRKKKHAIRKEPSPIRGIIKISLMFIIMMVAYLIVLPLLTAQFVPCLANHPFDSYTSNQCTVEGALDQFMKLALIGLSVLTMVFLVVLKGYLKITPFHDMKTWTKIPSRKTFILEFVPLVITTLLMAVCIVIFYMLFIPTAENAVRNAPIILDTVTQPLK